MTDRLAATCRGVAAVSCLLAGLVPAAAAGGAPPRELPQLRKLMGKDLEGAKIVAILDSDIITVDLSTGVRKTVASFHRPSNWLRGFSRPWFSPDGKQICLAFDGQLWVMNADGSDRRHIVTPDDNDVYEPCWWQDPASGELCIVYMNAHDLHWYRPKTNKTNPIGQTYLYRLTSKTRTKLADFPCDGGLSKDGTHLAEAYAGALIVDVRAQEYYTLYGGKRACNGSISPDNTYRMMHTYTQHEYFAIRNKWDHELWRIPLPPGIGKWQHPRWSNHPNYCVTLAQNLPTSLLAVVRIEPKDCVILESFGSGWYIPGMWLPSGVEAVRPAPGPIDHLRLKRLDACKARLAQVSSYRLVLEELAGNSDPEARLIEAELEKAGRAQLAQAAKAPSALTGAAIYREAAARFTGHPVGRDAQAALDAPAFQRRMKAAVELERMEDLAGRLQNVPWSSSLYTSEKFFTRNKPLLVEMTGIARRLRHGYGGTPEAASALKIARKYRLPDDTTESGNETIELVATIEAVSRVLDPAKTPYPDAVSYIRYRVDKVISGRYGGKRIMIVHWIMKGYKLTEAAQWQPGIRQQLTVDLFDAHRELESINATDTAQDLGLTPYWALKVAEAK